VTYIGIYAGTVNPKLIATSDDPTLVEEVARRILGGTRSQDPDPALRHLERGRREALKSIAGKRLRLEVVRGTGLMT
jgi:hypothetical protein